MSLAEDEEPPRASGPEPPQAEGEWEQLAADAGDPHQKAEDDNAG